MRDDSVLSVLLSRVAGLDGAARWGCVDAVVEEGGRDGDRVDGVLSKGSVCSVRSVREDSERMGMSWMSREVGLVGATM